MVIKDNNEFEDVKILTTSKKPKKLEPTV